LINAPSGCVSDPAESSQLRASVAFSSDHNCGAALMHISQHSSANDECTVHDTAIEIEVAGAARCIRRPPVSVASGWCTSVPDEIERRLLAS